VGSVTDAILISMSSFVLHTALAHAKLVEVRSKP